MRAYIHDDKDPSGFLQTSRNPTLDQVRSKIPPDVMMTPGEPKEQAVQARAKSSSEGGERRG